MLDSEFDEVAEEGAAEVCARWLFFGMFQEELERCKTGNAAQRKGVAGVASGFLDNEKYTSQCRELLRVFFNDDEREVRGKVRNAFHNKQSILHLDGVIDFLKEYIRTEAFRDDPTGLLYTLENYPGSLLPYADVVFGICEAFAGPLAELSRNLATGVAHDASMICPLILRLYEQSQGDHPDIRNRCLDAWDIMFEQRVGVVHDLMKQIDQ